MSECSLTSRLPGTDDTFRPEPGYAALRIPRPRHRHLARGPTPTRPSRRSEVRMTATTQRTATTTSSPGFLDRRRTVAPLGFNRWLIPPAALAVHLCIGQVYATSVYKTSLVEHFDTSLTAIGVIF